MKNSEVEQYMLSEMSGTGEPEYLRKHKYQLT